MTDVALALWSGTLGVVGGSIVTLVGSDFQQRWSFSKQGGRKPLSNSCLTTGQASRNAERR